MLTIVWPSSFHSGCGTPLSTKPLPLPSLLTCTHTLKLPGKSSLLVRLTDQAFLANSEPTVGVEFGSKLIKLDDGSIVKTREFYRGLSLCTRVKMFIWCCLQMLGILPAKVSLVSTHRPRPRRCRLTIDIGLCARRIIQKHHKVLLQRCGGATSLSESAWHRLLIFSKHAYRRRRSVALL